MYFNRVKKKKLEDELSSEVLCSLRSVRDRCVNINLERVRNNS